MSQTLKITVNGEIRAFQADMSVQDLLGALEIVGGKVAVERNRQIVPSSQHNTELLDDGDQIEIVHFIGGG